MVASLASLLPSWSTWTISSQGNPSPPSSNDPHPNQETTMKNIETSPLCKLPLEILLQIDHYLEYEWGYFSPNVAHMTIRATCRQLRSLLPFPETMDLKRGWSMYDKRGYTRILLAARFRAYCQTERDGTLIFTSSNTPSSPGEKLLVCSACRTAHPASAFSVAERATDPEKRVCMGSQNLLEICPHVRFNFHGARMQPVDFKCVNKEHFNVPGSRVPGGLDDPGQQFRQSVHIHALEEERERARKPREYGVSVMLRIANLERDAYWRYKEKEVLKEQLVSAIRKLEWKVCPHMHTSDVETWEDAIWTADIFKRGYGVPPPRLPRPLAATEKRASFLPAFLSRAAPSSSPPSSSLYPRSWCTKWEVHHCRVEYCDTNVFVVRETQHDYATGTCPEYLVLKVERALGTLRCATDKRWLAQTIDPNTLDDGTQGEDHEGE